MVVRKLRALIVLGFVAAAAIPSHADAARFTLIDQSIHDARDRKLDAVGTMGFLGVFRTGLGVWYSIPVVADGFIPPWNDSFVVEFGGFLDYWRDTYDFVNGDCTQSWWRATPMGGVRWDFFLTDEWTVFAKGKFGYSIGFSESYECNGFNARSDKIDVSSVAFDFGGGAYWNFSDGMALRLETGVHSLIAAGISIDM